MTCAGPVVRVKRRRGREAGASGQPENQRRRPFLANLILLLL